MPSSCHVRKFSFFTHPGLQASRISAYTNDTDIDDTNDDIKVAIGTNLEKDSYDDNAFIALSGVFVAAVKILVPVNCVQLKTFTVTNQHLAYTYTTEIELIEKITNQPVYTKRLKCTNWKARRYRVYGISNIFLRWFRPLLDSTTKIC